MRKTAAILAWSLMLGLPAAGGATSSSAEAAGATIADAARRAGIDVSQLMTEQVTITTSYPDGRTAQTKASLAHAIDAVARAQASAVPPVAGPAELNAGDLLHVYAKYCFPCASALGYAVSTSAVVPATPPVLLPAPATALFFDVGGPLTQVQGGGWLIGIHTVGTVLGSNVDTGSGAPAPFPVWLPVVTAGLVTDTSIDFIGHAIVAQGEACLLTFCIAVGTMVGDGLTLFDNTAPVSLPVLP